MDGAEKKACIFGGLVLGAYVVYMIGNPSADGIVFGTVMAVIAAIGGYALRGMTNE